VKVEGKTFISPEGNGPVNALDFALRRTSASTSIHRGLSSSISRAHPQCRHRGGHCAADRERDEQGQHWTTVGVSSNIIDARSRR